MASEKCCLLRPVTPISHAHPSRQPPSLHASQPLICPFAVAPDDDDDGNEYDDGDNDGDDDGHDLYDDHEHR